MRDAKLLFIICVGNLIVVLTIYQMNEHKRRYVVTPTGLAVQSVPLESCIDHVVGTINNFTSSTQDYIHPGYVSTGRQYPDSRGLGNLMFNFAVVVFVAELTGRTPRIQNTTLKTNLEIVFDMNIEKYDYETHKARKIREAGGLKYDKRVAELAPTVPRNTSIHMRGYHQSWKYSRPVERRLRQIFVVQERIRDLVDQFFVASVPPKWTRNFIRVGIHVRRGDIESPDKQQFGYTLPNRTYFYNAMQYFALNYGPRVQFFVVSNDMKWCKKEFPSIEAELNRYNASVNVTQARTASGADILVNVTYSVAHSFGVDFALLSSCDHVIMSTGTYGWWAAWLAKGTTVYYADWPRKGSSLWKQFTKEDFFPPSWIGMT